MGIDRALRKPWKGTPVGIDTRRSLKRQHSREWGPSMLPREGGLAGRWVPAGSQYSRCFLFMLIHLVFQTPLSLEVKVPCSFGDWKHLLYHGAEPSAGGAPSVYIISA